MQVDIYDDNDDDDDDCDGCKNAMTMTPLKALLPALCGCVNPELKAESEVAIAVQIDLEAGQQFSVWQSKSHQI